MKKSPKRPESPYAADVKTTPVVAEYDFDLLPPRADLSIINITESVPAPGHKGYPATVSNQKGGK